MKKQRFELTEDHLNLLSEMWIDTYDGQPILDRKRPFGNSFITGDVIEIVDYDRYEFIVDQKEGEFEEVDIEKARKLMKELHLAMSIVLQFGRQLGVYERGNYEKKWEATK